MGRIGRRQVLSAIATLLVACIARAHQSPKPRKIGFLGIAGTTHPSGRYVREALPAALARLGYNEGKNLIIEWRYAEGKPERLPALAEELVRLGVELIVTTSNASTLAAKHATRTIPIVMYSSTYPIESGLIKSYARPGGNITGLDWWPTRELAEKTYQFLRAAFPGAKQVVVLRNSKDPNSHMYGDEYKRKISSTLGLTIVDVDMRSAEDLRDSVDQIAAIRGDILYVGGGAAINARIREIAAFAIKRKLLSIGNSAGYADGGGLLQFGAERSAMTDRAASYVDRILRGAKPADLPVEQPTKYELVLNVKTAKAIGINLSPSFMARVDRVIE